jgi:hypothetical protein
MKSFVKILGLVMVLVLTVTPVMADTDVDPNPGNGNTDVVVMNMGSTSAEATALYYPPTGVNPEYTANANLAGKGSFRFAANAAAPLGDNWRGSMVVQSAGEVAAVAEIIWTNGSSADGTTADAYTGFSTGATTMYVPYVVWAPTAQFTLFSVQNTENSTADIRLTFLNRNGGQDLQVNDTIPALGSKGFDPRTFTQLQSSSFWQNNCSTGYCYWSGAVKVESTNGKKIAAAATNHWRDYAGAYSGVASGANRSYVSSVERRCTDCGWDPINGVVGAWRGFSIVNVQCLSSTPCQVRIQFVGQTSTMTSLTLPDRTVAAGAAISANTRAGDEFDQNLFNQLRDTNNPAGQYLWAGSVIVSTLNNTDVAVVTYNQRPDERIATGSGGAGAVNAGLSTSLPAVYKRGVCDGGTNWTTFSIIRIQNPGTTNATDVDIYYYGRDGVLAASELNRTIAAESALTRHTRVDCNDLSALGNNWEGSVYISSNQPLVAVAETYQNAFVVPSLGPSWAAGYNGYSVTP